MHIWHESSKESLFCIVKHKAFYCQNTQRLRAVSTRLSIIRVIITIYIYKNLQLCVIPIYVIVLFAVYLDTFYKNEMNISCGCAW